MKITYKYIWSKANVVHFKSKQNVIRHIEYMRSVMENGGALWRMVNVRTQMTTIYLWESLVKRRCRHVHGMKSVVLSCRDDLHCTLFVHCLCIERADLIHNELQPNTSTSTCSHTLAHAHTVHNIPHGTYFYGWTLENQASKNIVVTNNF